MFPVYEVEQKRRPPYKIILQQFQAGEVVPFLGSAASRVGYKDGDEGRFLPSGWDLSRTLARAAEFPASDKEENGDLAKVASYYVSQSNRSALRRQLRSIFDNSALESNELHALLARLANKSVIVTTNYDTLLEQAFNKIGKPYDLAVYPADNEEYRNAMLWWPHGASKPNVVKPSSLDIREIGAQNLIYKMHGSVCCKAEESAAEWDSYVITEEDYIEFLSRMGNAVPPAFRKFFSKRQFLFLGYSLRDWNLRVLLKKVTSPDMRSWAIVKNPTIDESVLWNSRNVTFFNETLENFVQNMSDEVNGSRVQP